MSKGVETHIYDVRLYDDVVGTLYARGDHTQFWFTDEYQRQVPRPVLGLHFEQNLAAAHSSALKLPPWFSNLLPEGILRQWMAEQNGVSTDREMRLLAGVGHDLPGAVTVVGKDENAPQLDSDWTSGTDQQQSTWKFSLAGAAIKFSMLRVADKLTLPARGTLGRMIVKTPDKEFAHVPANEFFMMQLASKCGIATPHCDLVNREEISGLPDFVWRRSEYQAYSVHRYDRVGLGQRVHCEDLCQVRNWHSHQKYEGSYETAANLLYRGTDHDSLDEFVRRLVFCLAIGNGDAHLKNWSIIYSNPHKPTTAPAYDLVCTTVYQPTDTMALKLNRNKDFSRVALDDFSRLARKVGADEERVLTVAQSTLDLLVREWKLLREDVTPVFPELREHLDERIPAIYRLLTSRLV